MLWSMVLRSTSAVPIGVGRTTRSAGMTVPGCRSGPASVTGCRSRYCSPSAESSLTRTGPLSGMCSPAPYRQFDGHVPRVEVEGRDRPHLHPPVGHVGTRVQAAGARHEDGDRERLGRDVVLHDVEGDVVDADDDDDGQGDHPGQEVLLHGSSVMTDSRSRRPDTAWPPCNGWDPEGVGRPGAAHLRAQRGRLEAPGRQEHVDDGVHLQVVTGGDLGGLGLEAGQRAAGRGRAAPRPS